MSGQYRGRCWKLGDDVSNDQTMSSQFVYEYDLEILKKNCLIDVVPAFPRAARAGDVVLAGKNFGYGSLHIHPFLALHAMGVAIVCRSMPRGALRLAIYAGVPILTGADDVHATVDDGDELEVDFQRGRIVDQTTSQVFQVPPLSPFLLEIIEAGGGIGYIEKSLRTAGPTS